MEAAVNALLAWNTARQEVNSLKAERSAHRCTESCSYDHETGDPGQAECWRLGDTENMCDACRARQTLREPIASARRKASRLRQVMQRQAARLQKIGSGNQAASAEPAATTRRSAAPGSSSHPTTASQEPGSIRERVITAAWKVGALSGGSAASHFAAAREALRVVKEQQKAVMGRGCNSVVDALLAALDSEGDSK